MTTEKFEETKTRFKGLRNKDLSIRIGHIWGLILANKDVTRKEVLELMEILFD